MSGTKNQDGFTLLEILVAVFIMSLGFLAAAQMQFLSLRQKQLAEQGTIATNVIQYISDNDMAQVRRRYLYNSTAYLDAQANRVIDFSYCDGSSPSSICNVCPCDPLEAITPNPDDTVTETTCAAIDINNFNPENLNIRTTQAQCVTDGAAIAAAGSSPLYAVKRSVTSEGLMNGVNAITVAVTYASKTPQQFEKTGLGSLALNDSLVVQNYEITAHVVSYSDLIPGWTEVNIPHIP